MRCQALNVLSPEATDEERKCTHEAGQYIFDGYYGPIQLCEAHTKSYQKAGIELRKADPLPYEKHNVGMVGEVYKLPLPKKTEIAKGPDFDVCIFCLTCRVNVKPVCSYGLHHEFLEQIKQPSKVAAQSKVPDKKLCVKCGLHTKNPKAQTNGCAHTFSE